MIPVMPTVLVLLHSDHPMAGGLLERAAYGIMLQKAAVGNEAGTFVPLPEPGRVFIPMRRIDMIQFLPDGALEDRTEKRS